MNHLKNAILFNNVKHNKTTMFMLRSTCLIFKYGGTTLNRIVTLVRGYFPKA